VSASEPNSLVKEAFGLSLAELEAAGARWTAPEILQQPALWLEIERQLAADAPRLAAFLTPLLAQPDLRIVLTGAGTSSFIGECLAPALARALDRRVDAVSTTDIVSSPESWLLARTPTLLVSFARSGNSPESTAALAVVNELLPGCAHLVVTCNRDGALHRLAAGLPRACTILLPEASNDRSFAMTSSFTGMLLAAALAFGMFRSGTSRVRELARLVTRLQGELLPTLAPLVADDFDRVVFLGSKELTGLAREAALKMLELTDGRVVAIADSTLGFRHGPKTFLNARTLVVLFVSHDAYARQYDLDLLSELRRESVAGRVVALTGSRETAAHRDTLPAGLDARSDFELCFPYAVFAQSLALLRSLSLGIRPDQPNAAGTVSRVVQGVTIYPWHRVP
jgi:tagatose-6-phosphate ketose/aldose isomerase